MSECRHEKMYQTDDAGMFCRDCGSDTLNVIGDLRAQVQELELAIRWALGESPEGAPEFPDRKPDQGAYYWRTMLRELSGIQHAPPEDSTPKTGFQQALETAEKEMTVVMGAGERWQTAQQESQND